MNCQEFLTQLDEQDSLDISETLEAHADKCPTCRLKLMAEKRMRDGFRVIRKCVPSPELAQRIRQSAMTQGITSTIKEVSWGSRFVEWFMWLAPNTPMKSTIFYGSTAFLIFLLCWAIISRMPSPHPLDKTQPLAQQWTLFIENGNFPSSVIASGDGTTQSPKVAFGQKLFFTEGMQGRLILPGRANVTIFKGNITPIQNGLRLDEGEASFLIDPIPPGEPAFVVETSLAKITVLGTAFHIILTKQRLDIEVSAGRVKVLPTTSASEKILFKGEHMTIDSHGLISVSSMQSPKTSDIDFNTNSNRPEVPQD